MKFPRLSLGELGITARLLLWFLAISLIPCGLLTGVIEYLIEPVAREEHQTRALARIRDEVVRDRKLRPRTTERRERRRASAFDGGAHTRLVALYEKEGPDSESYRKEVESFRKQYAFFEGELGYSNLYIFSVLTANSFLRLKNSLDLGDSLFNGPLQDTELAGVVDRARTLLQTICPTTSSIPATPSPSPSRLPGPQGDGLGGGHRRYPAR